MAKFYFKVHKHPDEVLISVCDEEILGQTFRGEKSRITVTEEFYGGDLVEEGFVLNNIGSFTILNIVGNRSVELAVREGLVSEDSVIIIGEVKHAQAVRM